VEGESSDLAGIEIKEGLEIARGNAEIYKKVLRKFYQSNSSTLAEIKKALENGETLVAAR
jgi:HPt (histidine-containing phosphotransfer) domain-containing protein